MYSKELLFKICELGEQYREDYLSNLDKNRIESDWWAALEFFFSKVFFQGRRDENSERVYHTTMKILNKVYSGQNDISIFRRDHNSDWKSLKQELAKEIGKGYIGKSKDIDLCTSALSFILTINENNLTKYSLDLIKDQRVGHLYVSLQRNQNNTIPGVISVGPKTASLYIRDLISLFELDNFLRDSDYFYVQPIDTWVKKVCEKIGIIDKDDNDSTIRENISLACIENGVSPFKFNQGAWYLGHNSFDIALNSIK
jgi:hypothetical protein